MKSVSSQFDLFDHAPGYRQTPRATPRKRRLESPPTLPGWDDEEAAQRLEQSGRYRILRKLVPRPIIPRAESAYPNLAVLVDTETTGLNQEMELIGLIGAIEKWEARHDHEDGWC